MAAKSRKKPVPASHPTNQWDAAIRLMDMFYDLISTGKFVAILVLLFFAWVMYVTYRLPEGSLDGYIGVVFDISSRFLSSEKYYIVPLSGTLIFSVSINILQRKVYRSDIKRLKEVRSILMHGLKSEELVHLKEHTSCDLSIDDV